MLDIVNGESNGEIDCGSYQIIVFRWVYEAGGEGCCIKIEDW